MLLRIGALSLIVAALSACQPAGGMRVGYEASMPIDGKLTFQH